MIDSKLTLSSYTWDQVFTGFILVKVNYYKNEATLKLYIVPDGGPPLLSRNWLSSLKINITNNIAVHNITHINGNNQINNLINEYKDIFDKKLGKFLDFKATLYLKPNTIPVFHKARSLLIHLKEKVENALEKLVNKGILTSVNYSEWASPIVPVIKKNGEYAEILKCR